MSLHTSVCMCLYISYTFLVVCSLKPANGLPVSTNGSPASLLNRPMAKQFFLYILGTSYPGPIPVLFLNTFLILSSSLVASLFPNAPGEVLRSDLSPPVFSKP